MEDRREWKGDAALRTMTLSLASGRLSLSERASSFSASKSVARLSNVVGEVIEEGREWEGINI